MKRKLFLALVIIGGLVILMVSGVSAIIDYNTHNLTTVFFTSEKGDLYYSSHRGAFGINFTSNLLGKEAIFRWTFLNNGPRVENIKDGEHERGYGIYYESITLESNNTIGYFDIGETDESYRGYFSGVLNSIKKAEWIQYQGNAVFYGDKGSKIEGVLFFAIYNLNETFLSGPNFKSKKVEDPNIFIHFYGYKIESAEQNQTDNEQRLSALESWQQTIDNLINAMRNWSGFTAFWNWFDSPQECELQETKCETDDRYTCIDYEWNLDQTCEFGCSDGKCNSPPRENCRTKESDYECRNYGRSSYSLNKDYYTCQRNHGTSTDCEPGFCRYRNRWSYCREGCDEGTGLCN